MLVALIGRAYAVLGIISGASFSKPSISSG